MFFGLEIGLSEIIAFVALVVSIASALVDFYHRNRLMKREQASMIWAWIEPSDSGEGLFDIVLSNQSGGLVYDVVATVVMRYGAGIHDGRQFQGKDGRVKLPVLKPGQRRFSAGHIDLSMYKTPGVGGSDVFLNTLGCVS